MPLYEHTFIARQDLSAQQAQGLAEEFGTTITERGGSVGKTEYWGLRTLAYRINKNRKGHYLHLNLDAPADAIEELERTQRLHEDVLRYLTVKVDELDEGQSTIMQVRSGRDDRGRRDRDRDRDRDRGESRRRSEPREESAKPAEDKSDS